MTITIRKCSLDNYRRYVSGPVCGTWDSGIPFSSVASLKKGFSHNNCTFKVCSTPWENFYILLQVLRNAFSFLSLANLGQILPCGHFVKLGQNSPLENPFKNNRTKCRQSTNPSYFSSV